jgi:hypothetical protein
LLGDSRLILENSQSRRSGVLGAPGYWLEVLFMEHFYLPGIRMHSQGRLCKAVGLCPNFTTCWLCGTGQCCILSVLISKNRADNSPP